MNLPPLISELGGELLVLAPHLDDEVLGCGGLLAWWPERERVRVLYATNGRGAENLRLPGAPRRPDLDMGAVRRAESEEALAILGLSPACALRLDVPEFGVRRQRRHVTEAIADALSQRPADWLVLPFRYDRHPDHVALYRCAREALRAAGRPARVLEYVVHYRWRLLPGGDVREACRPERVLDLELGPLGERKARAIRAYRSQTTLFFPWQIKPVLSEDLIREVSTGRERFLRARPEDGDRALFRAPRWQLRAVHTVEPWLKTRKEQVAFWWRRRRACRAP